MQVEFFSLSRPKPEEPDAYKYIRAFVEAHRIAYAEQYFREELFLYLPGYVLVETKEYNALVAFGQEVFGRSRANSIVAECVGMVNNGVPFVAKFHHCQAV